MSWPRSCFVAAVGVLAVIASCGRDALVPHVGRTPPPPDAGALAPAGSDAAASDGGAAVGSDGAGFGTEPSQPPPAAVDVRLRACGAMTNLPDVLGVDADGDVVLLARGSGAIPANTNASLQLFSRATGHVTRTITLDSPTGMLTADRLHVLTPTALLDLRSGFAVRRPPSITAPRPDIVLAISPAGDLLIAARAASSPSFIVSRTIADNQERILGQATGSAFAGAIADDGLRFFLLVAKASSLDSPITIEARRLSDGALEREIPLEGGAALPSGFGTTDGLLPQLATLGDFVLANIYGLGYRAFRVSDGAPMWAPGPEVIEAQLSPRPGLLAFRASSTDSWQELDMTTGSSVGTFAPSASPESRDVNAFAAWPLLAFTPDGSDVVFSSGEDLRVGHSDGSSTPLPFRSGGWGGRSVFVTDGEIASIEGGPNGGSFSVGVTKRAVPSGEVLAALSSDEAQSEWQGDIALAPDGRTFAVAFPDRVHLLRSADLHELAVIPRAAGRVVWSPDGAALITTPDLHYRDAGRPASDPPTALDVWTVDGALQRTFQLPFVPFFATFTADGLGIVATGQLSEQHQDAAQSGGISRVDFSGEAQSVKIDRATGATRTLGSVYVAVDAGRHFVTDLHAVARLRDDAPVATLDDPAFATDDPMLYRRLPAFSPDASLVAGIAMPPNSSPMLFLYASANGKTLGSLAVGAFALSTLAFSPDGRQLGVQPAGGFSGVEFICLGP